MSTTTDAPRRARMGTRTKGILAIVCGTALLLGGGGTYAYWSTSQALTAGDVQSGDLNLSLGTGEWNIKGILNASPVAVPDPSAVRIVPGDVLTLDQPVTVTLVGTTIAADLTINTATLVPAALQPYVTVAFTSSTLGTPTGANTFRVTPATAGTIQTTVTITFSGTAADRAGALETINLNNLGFTLTQASS